MRETLRTRTPQTPLPLLAHRLGRSPRATPRQRRHSRPRPRTHAGNPLHRSSLSRSPPKQEHVTFQGLHVRWAAALAVALAALALLAATLASGAMRSEQLGPRLCETTGGGRFVSIPGFPGERIDRRLLNDVRMLKRKYKIFITDGYSLDPVHSRNGEHP